FPSAHGADPHARELLARPTVELDRTLVHVHDRPRHGVVDVHRVAREVEDGAVARLGDAQRLLGGAVAGHVAEAANAAHYLPLHAVRAGGALVYLSAGELQDIE